jgi:diguanylate cyclase (GGDEF)-like protein
VVAGRQASALFAMAGAAGMLCTLVPGGIGYGDAVLRWVYLSALAVAACARFVVPWDRLPRCAEVALPIAALLMLAVANTRTSAPPVLHGIWFVVLSAWVGMWLGRGANLGLAPLIGACFVWSELHHTGSSSADVAAVALVVPAAVGIGHAIASTTERLRKATAAQEEAATLLRYASITDDLTGIGNRRHGNALLDGLGDGEAVALLDLDEFKRVNDTFGHAIGDQLLMDLSSHLQAHVPRQDLARFGGEEFLVVLRGVAPGEAERFVERLLASWRATGPVTTFSAGVSVHGSGRSPASTLRAADAALYAAKAAGRDCWRPSVPA